MIKKLVLVIIVCIVVACNGKEQNAKQKVSTLENFIDVNAIEKADNYGSFLLNKKQIEKLKVALKKLSYEPDQDIKVGVKGVRITIHKK